MQAGRNGGSFKTIRLGLDGEGRARRSQAAPLQPKGLLGPLKHAIHIVDRS